MSKSQIRLLGRNIPIHYVSSTEIDKLAKDKEILGYYCNSTQSIYINKTLKGKHAERVLRHELMHATLDISGLTNLIDDKLEEALCNVMESWAFIDE